LLPSAAAELADALGAAGLTEPRAIAAYGGATGAHAARLATSAAPLPITAASATLELLVAGRSIAMAAAERSLPVAALAGAGLIEIDGAAVTPRARVIPHRDRLLVCGHRALPDDSSFHLLGALPRRCRRWLDVGTGCGFAPLIAARLGDRRVAADIDAAAIELARIGALLCRQPGLELEVSDLFDAIDGRFDLISFNAPLPPPDGLLERFWAGAARVLEPGGEVVAHARGVPPAVGGELVIARYTPAASPESFAVSRWRPGAPAARREVAIELSVERPHVSRAAFDR
jgi:SAM-dependent methyltransferase